MNNITFENKITSLGDKVAKELYCEAFCETNESAELLFASLLNGSLNLSLSVDNERVCQLFLIDCDIVLDKSYPIYYLYAASTKKKFRGKGLMHSLIEYAKTLTTQNGKYGIVLRPANEGLFEFYKSCGFNKTLCSEVFEYTAKNDVSSCYEISASDYLKKREELLKDTPHVALKHNLTMGLNNHYRIFGNEKSIILAERYTENGHAFIAECLGDKDALDFVINTLNCTSATVKTIGNKTPFSVIWFNDKIKEPQYNIYHGPCFE